MVVQYTNAHAQTVSRARLVSPYDRKLHIVTDIKVNFNSMLGFRISIFGWGDGYFTHQIKS